MLVVAFGEQFHTAQCSVYEEEIKMPEISNSINQVTTFAAPDIECDGCANAIRNAIGRLAGVTVVAVDVDGKQIAVTHEPTTASDETLLAALDKAGFPATVNPHGK